MVKGSVVGVLLCVGVLASPLKRRSAPEPMTKSAMRMRGVLKFIV